MLLLVNSLSEKKLQHALLLIIKVNKNIANKLRKLKNKIMTTINEFEKQLTLAVIVSS